MRDLHGLRRAGGTRRQLHEGQVVLADLDGLDRIRCEQVGDGQRPEAVLLEHRHRDERLGAMTALASIRRRSSCPRPRPRGRCVEWAGEASSGWRHASTDPGRSARSRRGSRPARRRRRRGRYPRRRGRLRSAGPLVHLTPGVTNGFVRFTGDHARSRVTGIAVHLLGESAHDSLLGSPQMPDVMLRLVDGAFT